MTREDFNYLSIDSLYKFMLYYGEEKLGILTESLITSGNFYIIPKNNIEAFNDSKHDCETFGEKVLLDSISNHTAVSNFNNGWPQQRKEYVKGENKLAKKMIIFGAGATYDFSYSENIKENDRPPLTKDLFADEYDAILGNYPGARALSSRILTALNVEVFFQEQWNDIKNHFDPDSLNKIINTQYYFHELFLKISEQCKSEKRSNYVSLAELIGKYTVTQSSSILLVSFNYDTLLEKALGTSLALKYSEIDHYVDSKRKVYVFKPHGSCNWIRQFSHFPATYSTQGKNIFFSKMMYDSIACYGDIFENLKPDIIVKDDPDFTNNNNFQSPAYLPQLLIPFTDKDEFIMPLAHRQTLEDNLESIEEILIIGWKGTERVFKELLKKKLGNKEVKITMINNGDQTVVTELQDCFKQVQWSEEKTFSDFIKKSGKETPDFFKSK